MSSMMITRGHIIVLTLGVPWYPLNFLEACYTAKNRVEDSKPRHIEKDGTYMCRICNSIGAHIDMSMLHNKLAHTCDVL
jgi:hypothetical protein